MPARRNIETGTVLQVLNLLILGEKHSKAKRTAYRCFCKLAH